MYYSTENMDYKQTCDFIDEFKRISNDYDTFSISNDEMFVVCYNLNDNDLIRCEIIESEIIY